MAARPNIILILNDDMGYSDLGCYGGEVHTPNLDALARGGMRFTRFYAGSTVCAPARSVLMTGQHAGRTIIRQGDVGDRFYIVRRGHVEVTQRDDRGVSEIVNQLDRGDYFGEVALLRDAPRNATCRATIPTETLSLARHDFDMLVKERFALRDKVDRSLARAELLRRLPLFAELDGLQIQHVAAQLQEEELEAGAVFIRQGELGHTFYLIESGRVEVFVTGEGEEQAIVQRGPGEYVGEIALLLAVPRTASVRTLEPTNLLVLRKRDFERLVSEHLFISRGLEQESSRRMIDLRRAVPQA
jgi:CRP-like cAMP-binding protein